MRMLKRRRYYFSDASIASDTVIAFVFGTLALLIEIAGIICSIVTKGNIPELMAVLILCAMVMSVSGIIFALIGMKAQKGGVKGKRFSLGLNIFTLLLPIIIMIF